MTYNGFVSMIEIETFACERNLNKIIFDLIKVDITLDVWGKYSKSTDLSQQSSSTIQLIICVT